MGRPLRPQTIEKMELVTTKGKLVKQVGFNKYKVEDESIVILTAEAEHDEYVNLALSNGEKVVKILRNLVQTDKGVHAYKLNDEGRIVFEDKTLSLGESTPSVSEDESTAKAASPKKASKKTQKVVEETLEEVSEETESE